MFSVKFHNQKSNICASEVRGILKNENDGKHIMTYNIRKRDGKDRVRCGEKIAELFRRM